MVYLASMIVSQLGWFVGGWVSGWLGEWVGDWINQDKTKIELNPCLIFGKVRVELGKKVL